MISFLSGQIKSINPKSLTLLVNGVGYLVHLTQSTAEQLIPGKNLEIFIYTKVREDEISLFGFITQEQLDFFNDLISVNGIGPKSALEILNAPIDQTKTAIIQENPAYLSKLPGIGKKTAERIIVELKNKVQPKQLEELTEANNAIITEAASALTNLGYQHHEIHRVLKTMPTEITQTEEAITFFLKNV